MRSLQLGLQLRAALAGTDHAIKQHGQHEEAGQQQAGDHAGEIEARHGGGGDQAIEDEVDRRRDEDAERAAGRQRAEKQALVVTADLDLRQCHDADGGGRRHARPGGGREDGAGADVGVHQPARQPGEPLGHGVVDAHGNPRAQQHLAQHDEHRNGDEDVFGARVPDDVAHRPVEGHRRVELVERKAQHAHDGGDGDADGEQDDQKEERGAEHGSVLLRGLLGLDAETFELALDLLVLGGNADGGGDFGIVSAHQRHQTRASTAIVMAKEKQREAEEPRQLRIGQGDAQRRVGAVPAREIVGDQLPGSGP